MNKRLSLFLFFAILAIVNSMGLRKQIKSIPERNAPRPVTIEWATTTMYSKLFILYKILLLKDASPVYPWTFQTTTKTEATISPGSKLKFFGRDNSCDFRVTAKITFTNYKGEIQEYKSGRDWLCNDKKPYLNFPRVRAFHYTHDIFEISGQTCNDSCTFTIPLE